MTFTSHHFTYVYVFYALQLVWQAALLLLVAPVQACLS